MDAREYWAVCLAGLLSGMDGCLPALSGKACVDIALLRELTAAGPPGGEAPLRELVEKARLYASLAGHAQGATQGRLTNAFSRVELGGYRGSGQSFYPGRLLDAGAVFPEAGEPRGAGGHLQGFQAECRRQLASVEEPEEIFRRLQLLLKAYYWCVPGCSGDGEADVSLYDQLSLASAISACLYRYSCAESGRDPADEEAPRFLLAAGDVSGIQRYIVGEGAQGAKGLAKRLRARSFIVSAITCLASQSLLETCGLPDTCLIMNGGGNFYLLLPNTRAALDRLDSLRGELDRQLFEKFSGELYITLAFVELGGADFSEFGRALDRLRDALAVERRRPLATQFLRGGAWDETAFVIKNDALNRGLGVCTGCNREYAETVEENEKIGRRCNDETRIGGTLPSLQKIRLKQAGGEFLSSGHLALSVMGSEGRPICLGRQDSRELCPVWPIATWVPTGDRGPLTFEEIAGKARGAGYLAWLKADVDNLSSLFSLGFKDEQGHRHDTAARIASLSRMLDTFFAQWFPQYVEKNYKNCYIVYSGGDDLCAVGPWSDMLPLARDLRSEFHRFTGGHEGVTLSAGIAVCHCKLPVVKAFQMVDEALEKSKTGTLPGEAAPKNQLTVFGRTLKWSRWPQVYTEAVRLAGWRKDNLIASSDLYKFKQYAGMFEEFERGRVGGLKYAGLLSWDIAKKMQDNKLRQDEGVREWMERLFNIGPDALIRHLGIICDYALLANRKGESNGQ